MRFWLVRSRSHQGQSVAPFMTFVLRVADQVVRHPDGYLPNAGADDSGLQS